jgi:hypothetical protein
MSESVKGVPVVNAVDGRCPFCHMRLGREEWHLCTRPTAAAPVVPKWPRTLWRLPKIRGSWVEPFNADPWGPGANPDRWREMGTGRIYLVGEDCWETKAEAVRELWRANYQRLREARRDLLDMGKTYGHGDVRIARALPVLGDGRNR